MTPHIFKRRPFDQWVRERLINEALARYLDWRAESEAVHAAYSVWSSAPRTEGELPFAAYTAALDREEHAATVYSSVIDRIEQLFGGEDHVVGTRPRAARA